MRSKTRWFRLATMLFALSLVAAACGRDDDDDGAGSATTDASDDASGDTADDGEGEGGAPAEAPGFDGETITLGVITPVTGPVAVIGEPLTNGNRVYVDYVNAELGGVAGRYPIELVEVDSEYNPTVAVQQYNAIKDDVTLFAQVLGTPSVNAVLEQLERDNVVASPASLDSFWVREQNLLPIGAPYQIQAINALSWYLTDGGGEGQTICTAIQNDPYGQAGQQGVDFAAGELGFEVATTATFNATDEDYTAQVAQLQGAACEAVFLVSTPTPTNGMLSEAASQGYAPQWIGQSPSWLGLFALSPLAPYLQENFLLVGEGPVWGDTSNPGMAQMLTHVEAYAPDQAPDTYFTFGYAQAWSVVQVLEKAVELGDLSRDGIVEAMNSLDELAFDDLFGAYEWGSPEDRDPPRASTILSVDPAAPTGLATAVADVESDAAKAFDFGD